MGTLGALGVLGLLVLLLGSLLDRVPLHLLQLFVGVLLLVFGLGWLRKAVLRAAGIIPLHDEDAIFASETVQLTEVARRHTSLDWIAGLTAFKAVLLEVVGGRSHRRKARPRTPQELRRQPATTNPVPRRRLRQ